MIRKLDNCQEKCQIFFDISVEKCLKINSIFTVYLLKVTFDKFQKLLRKQHHLVVSEL